MENFGFLRSKVTLTALRPSPGIRLLNVINQKKTDKVSEEWSSPLTLKNMENFGLLRSKVTVTALRPSPGIRLLNLINQKKTDKFSKKTMIF